MRAAELGAGIVLDGAKVSAETVLSLLVGQYRRGAAAASSILARTAEPGEALARLPELAS
jgi:hypothetical protein